MGKYDTSAQAWFGQEHLSGVLTWTDRQQPAGAVLSDTKVGDEGEPHM